MTDSRNPRQQLWDLIHEMRFGMLTHRHADGSLHAHPLTTQNRELGADDCLYFFVSRATELGQRLRADGNVNVAYASPEKDTYVSVTGQARVLDDARLRKELFSPMAKAWFPGGPDDPDLELVQVRIGSAEYWNVRENKAVQLYKMAKAAATGTRPDDLGEHGEVRLGGSGAAP